MRTSMPYHAEPIQVPDDDQLTVRLRGLSAQQLLDAMTFLAFWMTTWPPTPPPSAAGAAPTWGSS